VTCHYNWKAEPANVSLGLHRSHSSRHVRIRQEEAQDSPRRLIFAIYGNPPPPKRANVQQAIGLACEDLLLGVVDRKAVAEHARALAVTPIPYSTHDLALSALLSSKRLSSMVPYWDSPLWTITSISTNITLATRLRGKPSENMAADRFDVVDFTTSDGKSKTLYFELSDL